MENGNIIIAVKSEKLKKNLKFHLSSISGIKIIDEAFDKVQLWKSIEKHRINFVFFEYDILFEYSLEPEIEIIKKYENIKFIVFLNSCNELINLHDTGIKGFIHINTTSKSFIIPQSRKVPILFTDLTRSMANSSTWA